MSEKNPGEFEFLRDLPAKTEEFVKSDEFDRAINATSASLDLATGTPVFTLIKALKDFASSYQNMRFANKILDYFNHIKALRISERVEFLEMLHRDTGKKAGKVILDHIDDMDEEYKIPLFAKITIAYARKRISLKDFERLTHILRNVFYNDLIELPLYEKEYYEAGQSEELYNNGLIDISFVDYGLVDENAQVNMQNIMQGADMKFYRLNSIGKLFTKLLNDEL